MISLPFRRSAGTIDALYGMIVAQARQPIFYSDYGVPDTVEGRLDMIVLHLVLVIRSLTAAGAPSSPGQQLFDRFCRDMDDNLREMGIGDLSVPRHMRRVAEVFYGRAKAYEAALTEAEGTGALEAAVARNVFGDADVPLGARRLAAYMRTASERLRGQGTEALARGEFAFPAPDAIVRPEALPRPS